MYYSHLNTAFIAEKALLVRDIAHDMKNIYQGQIKKEIPQIETLNQQLGQIENQVDKILIKIPNKKDIGKHVLKVSRKVKFLDSLVKNDIFPEIEELITSERLQKFTKFTNLMVYLDNLIDQEFKRASFEANKDESNQDNKLAPVITPIDHLEEEIAEFIKSWNHKVDLEESKLKEKVTLDKFNAINLQMMRELSNNSHKMQNIVTADRGASPNRKLANKINNAAGQAENEARNMQETAVKDTIKEKGNLEKRVKKLQNDYQNQADNMNKYLFKVSEKIRKYEDESKKNELLEMWNRCKNINSTLENNFEIMCLDN